MHQYLRSIGFSKLTREQDIDKLLRSCEKRGIAGARRYIDSAEQMWLDIRVPVSEHLGLCIVGYIGARGIFHRTAYYPYLWSSDATSTARPSVFRRVDGGVFSAIIDDARVGMTLIYQLDNSFDYLHKFGEGNSVTGPAVSKLSGFCTKGFVLLPSRKDNELRKPQPTNGPAGDSSVNRTSGVGNDAGINETANANEAASKNVMIGADSDGTADIGSAAANSPVSASSIPDPTFDVTNHNPQETDARMSLLEAARNGQTEAIEQLAFEEMNTIATLSKRLQNEDIYSIVSSVFMPQGVECDIYLVVGDILKIDRITNTTTGDEIFDLTLNVNDMIIHVAINESDLEGEPLPGRRFKGRIWLQGRIEY